MNYFFIYVFAFFFSGGGLRQAHAASSSVPQITLTIYPGMLPTFSPDDGTACFQEFITEIESGSVTSSAACASYSTQNPNLVTHRSAATLKIEDQLLLQNLVAPLLSAAVELPPLHLQTSNVADDPSFSLTIISGVTAKTFKGRLHNPLLPFSILSLLEAVQFLSPALMPIPQPNTGG